MKYHLELNEVKSLAFSELDSLDLGLWPLADYERIVKQFDIRPFFSVRWQATASQGEALMDELVEDCMEWRSHGVDRASALSALKGLGYAEVEAKRAWAEAGRHLKDALTLEEAFGFKTEPDNSEAVEDLLTFLGEAEG